MSFRAPNLPGSVWLAAGALALAGLSVLALSYPVGGRKKKLKKKESFLPEGATSVSIAFLGNSIFYFNDCPRLVELMLKTRYEHVVQNSCLRGGASLRTLFERGNGMQHKFNTPTAVRSDHSYDIGAPSVETLLSERSDGWDFVVLNDFTQHPAREESREETKDVLKRHYMDYFQDCGATVVFLQTPAYRLPDMRGTEDLGSFDEFTALLTAGMEEYVQTVPGSVIAPLGIAFQVLHDKNRELWNKLYSHDDFHFSPHGTWLEACCIFCTITGTVPPPLNPLWWDHARYMQPPDQKPLPLPTIEEALELRDVACSVCGIEPNVSKI